MADYIFSEWKQTLDEFRQSVQKDLEEIHKQKAEVQQLKTDIYNKIECGQYYRDDQRIVISAPEIVIGNVDYSGDLLGCKGKVIIKGSEVDLEGAGSTGTIVSRAPSIRQMAVDPGTDGLENVVCETSEIVNQACDIVLQSDDATDAFSQMPAPAGRGGIRIHATNNMQIEATVSAEKRKEEIEAHIKQLTKQISEYEKQVDGQKKTVDDCFDKMQKLLEAEDKLNETSIFTGRLVSDDLTDIHEDMDNVLPALYQATSNFIHIVSSLAEANRRKKALETEKNAIKTGDDFKNNTTGASMNIAAESISMTTTDGDGNLHINEEAGINVRTPFMGVNMINDKGTLTEGSAFNVSTENVAFSTINPSADGKEYPATGSVTVLSKDVKIAAIDYDCEGDDKPMKEKQLTADGKVSITAKTVEVSTANPTNIKVDDKGKITGGEYKAEGDVIIKSKTLTVESLDYEMKDGKPAIKALTKDSKIAVRAEKMDLLAADAEGKATGAISMNAKAVTVKSMDVDKEKLTDDKLAAGSTMMLVSEKMYMGAKSKDVKSKKLQAVSEELGLFADKTFEAQQGDGKAVVQLDGGNANVGGSKTQVYGDTTVNGKTEVKGDLKAPKGQFDNLEAKSSFKSSNISDGIAVPGAAAGGSLSAKLKTEDAPAA
jgi:F0F1-type ATP synthase membrane subunit b/b'